MNPTTLNQYYQSQGQSLPSVSDRQSAAAQAGIQNYSGTAAQNQQLLNSLQSGGATTTTTTPPTIPVNVALGSTNQINLPTRPTTNSGQLSAVSGGYIQQPAITNLNQLGGAAQIASQNANKATTDYQTQALDLINKTQNRPGELQQQFNIQGLSQDALTAKSQYDATELRYRREVENTMTNGALSAEQKQASVNEIERKKASQLADIAIDYNLKQGLLSNAKELMNQQLQLELEPLKMKVDYYKTLKQDYSDVFTQTQNRVIDQLQKKEERAYQEAKDANNFKQSLLLQAMKDGKYTPGMSKMTVDEIAKSLGTTVQDETKKIQDEQRALTAQKLVTQKVGKNAAVGANFLSRGRNQIINSGKRKEFIGDTENVLSSFSLNGFIDAKKAGATFGALSQGEMAWLQNSATGLSNSKITNKDGKVVGYDISQDTYDKYMKQIYDVQRAAYKRNYGIDLPDIAATEELDKIMGSTSSANIPPETNQQLEQNWNNQQ